jgi:hypothetical protein
MILFMISARDRTCGAQKGNQKMTNSSRLGPAERAVYELVERGAIDAAHAALYRRPLIALHKHGLVKRLESGAYEAIRASTERAAHAETMPAPPPPSSTPEVEPMATLVVRVPAHIIATLDEIGPSRSKAARAVLTRALGSGLRKAAGGVRS